MMKRELIEHYAFKISTLKRAIIKVNAEIDLMEEFIKYLEELEK